MITDNLRLAGAYHQAKLALGAGKKGDAENFARIQNRMMDTLESCDYPRLTTMRLAKRLGRGKALVLGIDRPLIALGLKLEGW